MNVFNVGDKVRVLRNEDPCCFIVGEICTITEVHEYDEEPERGFYYIARQCEGRKLTCAADEVDLALVSKPKPE